MEKVSQASKEQTIALHLASIMQRWSEICRRGVDLEISPELQYYMAGRADAHQMDAARCRSASAVDTQNKPPDDLMRFSKAYEIILGMLEAATPLDTIQEKVEFEELEEVESPIQITALNRLRARAAQLVKPPTEEGD